MLISINIHCNLNLVYFTLQNIYTVNEKRGNFNLQKRR